MSTVSAIPAFYLYGEPHRSVQEAFVHLESLDDRSRPSEWTIRPHTHLDLNHIFHIGEGGGVFQAEERRLAFNAPCLLIAPARMAHGFSWQSESKGAVITLSTRHLHSLCDRDPELKPLFRAAAVVQIGVEHSRHVNDRVVGLMREYSWARRGARAALDAGLLDLMVLALRGIDPASDADMPAPGHQAEVVARLRERIEERFRFREPVKSYAEALRVSLFQLRAACSQIARQSPSEMIDQRTNLEAKRALLYSNLSIAEVGYSLGFADAAYFSRFFSRHNAISPREFRERRGDPRANIAAKSTDGRQVPVTPPAS